MNEKEVAEQAAEELMELGVVSEETRGGILGYFWDGGFGKRI